MIKVEGHSNLFRDEKTGAIINMDNNEYEKYLKLKRSLSSNRQCDQDLLC